MPQGVPVFFKAVFAVVCWLFPEENCDKWLNVGSVLLTAWRVEWAGRYTGSVCQHYLYTVLIMTNGNSPQILCVPAWLADKDPAKVITMGRSRRLTSHNQLVLIILSLAFDYVHISCACCWWLSSNSQYMKTGFELSQQRGCIYIAFLLMVSSVISYFYSGQVYILNTL